jgi:MtN3 and saliva related transmembrane protein
MLEELAWILTPITTVVGSLMSLAYVPQIYKIWKRKSVEDISIILFTILFAGIMIWLLYGLSINNTPLIIANAIGLVSTGGIIILWFKYKKR